MRVKVTPSTCAVAPCITITCAPMPVASDALSPSIVMSRVSSATSARSSTVAPPITSHSPQCAKRSGCSSRTVPRSPR